MLRLDVESKNVMVGINKNRFIGLPWWCSGYESMLQCGEHWSGPWSGKTPHAMEQPSPRATTRETPSWRMKTQCSHKFIH